MGTWVPPTGVGWLAVWLQSQCLAYGRMHTETHTVATQQSESPREVVGVLQTCMFRAPRAPPLQQARGTAVHQSRARSRIKARQTRGALQEPGNNASPSRPETYRPARLPRTRIEHTGSRSHTPATLTTISLLAPRSARRDGVRAYNSTENVGMQRFPRTASRGASEHRNRCYARVFKAHEFPFIPNDFTGHVE